MSLEIESEEPSDNLDDPQNKKPVSSSSSYDEESESEDDEEEYGESELTSDKFTKNAM